MSRKSHFEGLLDSYLKMIARRPLKTGEKPIPELKAPFREGFKCALIVMELIRESTMELNEDQLDILNSRLEEMTGIKPPLPEEPNEES